MAGLVPATCVLPPGARQGRRGCPRQARAWRRSIRSRGYAL